MQSGLNQPLSIAKYAAQVIAVAGLGFLAAKQVKPLLWSHPEQANFIPSPCTTQLPHLTEAEANALPYPPNLLPGARDVETPYGTMRVYEWGPTAGRKVVLIHGDSTPSPILGSIAHELVARGCRVLLFGKSIVCPMLISKKKRPI